MSYFSWKGGEVEKIYVSEKSAGARLDNFLTIHLSNKTSRSQIKKAIDEGLVLINDEVAFKAGIIVDDGDIIEIAYNNNEIHAKPENIPLSFIYQNDELAVVYKPREMVVHPGAGVSSGTLLNGLLFHLKDADKISRAGIVHRLDKNTAGLLLVAKTAEAMTRLSKLFEERKIRRVYVGIVEGILNGSGTINRNIVRDTRNRTLFTTHEKNGRSAITHYQVLNHFQHLTTKIKYSLVKFELETGRTHQIRVHAKWLGHPLVGDIEYNPRSTIKASGQMLEAIELGFDELSFNTGLSEEFLKILDTLTFFVV